jgi:hypothetical protein
MSSPCVYKQQNSLETINYNIVVRLGVKVTRGTHSGFKKSASQILEMPRTRRKLKYGLWHESRVAIDWPY